MLAWIMVGVLVFSWFLLRPSTRSKAINPQLTTSPPLNSPSREWVNLPKPKVVTVRSFDDTPMDCYVFVPPRAPRGVVIIGHAMMADASYVVGQRSSTAVGGKPCIAQVFVDEGLLVIVPEMRGRGSQGTALVDWSYSDFVYDTACYIELALSEAKKHSGSSENLPLFLVGHSLFGHTALAWLGQHPSAPVTALICVAGNTWNMAHCASWYTAAAKTVSAAVGLLVCLVVGKYPSRELKWSNANEAPTFFTDILTTFFKRRWTGTVPTGYRSAYRAVEAGEVVDFAEGLKHIRVPFMHVLSSGDAVTCAPADGLLFSDAISRRYALHLTGGAAPSHMGLLTNKRLVPLWRHMAHWLCQSSSEQAASGVRCVDARDMMDPT